MQVGFQPAGCGQAPKSIRLHEQPILGFATRRDKAGIDAGKEDKDSMDNGKVEKDAKYEDIDREGGDDAAQEAHALRILQHPG